MGAGGYYVALFRHFPDGLPDSLGFGTNGRVQIHFDFLDQADALALQPDGKIVAVGMQNVWTVGAGTIIPSIYRFNSDGTPDTTFDHDGWTASRFEPVSSGRLSGVRVTPEGKILAAGVCTANANGGHFGFALRRLLSSGAPNPSFGSGGTIIHTMLSGQSLSYSPPGVAFLPDGGALIATHWWDGRYEFIAVRVDSAGALVPFASGYTLKPDVPVPNTEPVLVASLPDGRFVLAASTVPPEGVYRRFTVLAFHSNGDPDTTFGADGRVDIAFSTGDDYLKDVMVDPSGRIVLVGTSGNITAAMARLLPDGALDPGFGTGGKMTMDVSIGDGSGYFTTGLLASPDALLTAGLDHTSGSGDFVITRFGVSVVGVDDAVPSSGGFALRAPYPNPTRGRATFSFELPRECRVSLEIYDAQGRRVAELANGRYSAGRHSVTWSGHLAGGDRAAAGLYFARLTAEDGFGRVLYRSVSRLVRVP